MEENKSLRNDVNRIISKLITKINPYEATKKCVETLEFNNGRKILIAIGKAAWTMATAVVDTTDVDSGVLITKYNHSKGELKNIKVFEAGHPIVDENSIKATEYVLKLTDDLKENDNVILCISGGGSALFEKPEVSLSELQNINEQLIKSGADINEINIIRKRLSAVKGGKFALHCGKAHISAIILSDVVGNDLGTIASGPAFEDHSTCDMANEIIDKYNISISDEAKKLINKETVKNVSNVESYIVGSVEELCADTKKACEEIGYKACIVQSDCKDNVEDIALRLTKLINENVHNEAYIIGGESSVEVKGNGLGGRNSELALRCAKYIKGLNNLCVFTFGSDGTDGPTDAAGGYVDGETASLIDIDSYLKENDSYHALEKTCGLIKTGPTGTNINDIYVLLIR